MPEGCISAKSKDKVKSESGNCTVVVIDCSNKFAYCSVLIVAIISLVCLVKK